MAFDWHSGTIERYTVIDGTYRNTQKVRRFMLQQCGADFRFDRPFMAWIRNGTPSTMGDVVDEWKRRHGSSSTRPAV